MKILATFLYQMFNTSLIVAVLTLISFTLFLAIMTLKLAVSVIQADRKSTRLNSSHSGESRMPSSA